MEITGGFSGHVGMSGYGLLHSWQVWSRPALRAAAPEDDALVARPGMPGEVRNPTWARRADGAAGERAGADHAEIKSRADPPRRPRDGENENGPAKANADASVRRASGFEVEFQGKHRVVKVSDSRGVLIYQVPPKGQLQLIQAEESKARVGERMEVFA